MQPNDSVFPHGNRTGAGIDMRTYIATAAMQGTLGLINGLPHNANDQSYIAKLAVDMADALLAELNKPKNSK